jgi:hypothetical protein
MEQGGPLVVVKFVLRVIITAAANDAIEQHHPPATLRLGQRLPE